MIFDLKIFKVKLQIYLNIFFHFPPLDFSIVASFNKNNSPKKEDKKKKNCVKNFSNFSPLSRLNKFQLRFFVKAKNKKTFLLFMHQLLSSQQPKKKNFHLAATGKKIHKSNFRMEEKFFVFVFPIFLSLRTSLIFLTRITIVRNFLLFFVTWRKLFFFAYFYFFVDLFLAVLLIFIYFFNDSIGNLREEKTKVVLKLEKIFHAWNKIWNTKILLRIFTSSLLNLSKGFFFKTFSKSLRESQEWKVNI